MSTVTYESLQDEFQEIGDVSEKSDQVAMLQIKAILVLTSEIMNLSSRIEGVSNKVIRVEIPSRESADRHDDTIRIRIAKPN
jgi:hypothetical protein